MQGCFVHGLYIEGARFDLETNQLQRSLPKVLVEELAILAVVPIEAHRLKLQVCIHPHGLKQGRKQGGTGFSDRVRRRLQVTSTNVRLYLHTHTHTHPTIYAAKGACPR